MKNLTSLKQALAKKEKIVVMLAPSFVADFNYPEILYQLKSLGFDKITELTFGAKMVNRDYHRILEENEKKGKKLVIATVCPGIVNFVKTRYPQYTSNLISVVSPMIATARICKKIYPKHKTCFISPCEFKKTESNDSKYVDFCIDYNELRELIKNNKNSIKKTKSCFDKFYNDYTKIYPLAGGLSKTAHLRGVLKPGEEVKIDGIHKVELFLKNPDKKIRFMDVTFCIGGCLGGPCILNKNIIDKKEKLMNYLELAKKEKMPKGREGLIKEAKGINFEKKY